ncbi:3-deoxy-7-phosphoheptulonate synthase [Sedimentibacter hydroxybenzoicus DSM 7310]|uniref:3-deoxy-7-phosphoheptulonate synthase n=1 Tax=Sedimentibacter hydroxybenzoicus DSM 7310 TaxID=1123245 RepID=A0A974GWJ8_SEDHY|nr:3-deoxy-7-phosphoheptulonate synthase [Sedimentibacter hydroxybenzoicus]NYB74572.1 3-deoxy-7-phosphoheptulonate synthase [Sedimentibacter hydroxybenzoicus DSM 7310]
MLLILNKNADNKEISIIKGKINKLGLEVNEIKELNYHILGLIGDVSKLDPGIFEAYKAIDKVIFVQEPYKKANRLLHPNNTEIKVNNEIIGGNKINIIAGPCSVENQKQILSIADDVKKYGAKFLRGGAFKPRTSPYSFQGLKLEGLELLKLAKQYTGLPIVTELTSLDFLDEYVDSVDIIQVGARNMQNYEMLKQLGKINKPILLKRGPSSTVEELLMSAEYILLGGNENVILCERGIRTFESYTRNTLDLSAIPVIKKLSHLPVIVDPSHATGRWWMVEPMALASIAAGADGLIIEVHNDPENALCDGNQSIKPDKLKQLMEKLKLIAKAVGRDI